MFRSHRLFTGLAVGVGLLLATACGGAPADSKSVAQPTLPAGNTLAKIQQKGKLVVGTKFDQPLFGLKDPIRGEIVGFDAEIGRQLAKAITGAPTGVEFVEAVSKNREAFLMEGRVDIVIATYTINDARKQQIDFAGPYYTAGQDLMVRSDDTTIAGPEDTAGKKVCSGQGSVSGDRLKQLTPTVELLLLDTYSKCAEALADKRVDAVTTDDAILLGLIDNSKGAFKLVGKPFSTEPYGIGVKKGSDDLRQFVNDELERMFNDGRWKAAYDQTLAKVAGPAPKPPTIDRS